MGAIARVLAHVGRAREGSPRARTERSIGLLSLLREILDGAGDTLSLATQTPMGRRLRQSLDQAIDSLRKRAERTRPTSDAEPETDAPPESATHEVNDASESETERGTRDRPPLPRHAKRPRLDVRASRASQRNAAARRPRRNP